MMKVVKKFKNGIIGIKCNFCKGYGNAPNTEFDDTVNKVCTVCKGKGFNVVLAKINNLTPCKRCNSSGRRLELLDNPLGYFFLGEPCEVCKGTGIIILKFELTNFEEFDIRNFHPEIVKHSRELFLNAQWFHAVFEACKAFEEYVQNASELSFYGSELMSKALSLKGPLSLSSLNTITEKNKQEGIMHLAMGVTQLFRNPVSHRPAKKLPIKKQEALEILSLFNLLYKKIDAGLKLKKNENSTRSI